MYESLHNHTTASDGAQTYLEVLESARGAGIGVVAFTDHDTLPSEADLTKLSLYDGPTKWLIGCEISSGLPTELGGGPTSSLHILGLFTDPDNEALREHCRLAIAARNDRMEQIVANLKGLGFTISVADCLEASGGESVGRPHIVKALFSHPENDAIIDAIKDDMEKAATGDLDLAMKYMRLLERDRSDYPYRLFLSDDSFINNVYVDYLYSVDFDTAVKLIRDAGGIAIMAHWYTVSRSITLEMLEGMLKDGRLDGIEIMGKPDNGDAVSAAPQLAALAERTGCAAIYGIDGHTSRHFQAYSSDRNIGEASAGHTKRLVERFKPDLDWTNFPDGVV